MFCEFKKPFQHRIYRLREAHNNNGYLINYGIIVMENWVQMCKRDNEKKMFGNIFQSEIYSRYIEISKLNF